MSRVHAISVARTPGRNRSVSDRGVSSYSRAISRHDRAGTARGQRKETIRAGRAGSAWRVRYPARNPAIELKRLATPKGLVCGLDFGTDRAAPPSARAWSIRTAQATSDSEACLRAGKRSIARWLARTPRTRWQFAIPTDRKWPVVDVDLHPLPAHVSNYVLGARYRFSECFRGNSGTAPSRVRPAFVGVNSDLRSCRSVERAVPILGPSGLWEPEIVELHDC